MKAIRKITPHATIAVAGYPEMHQSAISFDDDLRHLKEKVDAGSDFIITNICFSFDRLSHFIKSCRAIGITVPIIAGIYIPSSYAELNRMSSICRFSVPEDQMLIYHHYQSDKNHFLAYAITNAISMLKQIFDFDFEKLYGVHFFTLNKYEIIFEVLQKL